MNKIKQLKIPLANVWNVVDIRRFKNFELAMLIKTHINNKDTFYTDLNGFQYVKRKRFDKLTLGGNVYSMPAGAFIQDDNLRLSLLSAQSLGFTSLNNCEMQVFMDRILMYDDNLGLSQGVQDNVIVSSRFLLLFEIVNKENKGVINKASFDFPSLLSSLLSNNLLYPIVKLILKNPSDELGMFSEKKFLTKRVPCDIHLVNLRIMQTSNEEPRNNEVGMILFRMPYDDCVDKKATSIKPSKYIESLCENEDQGDKFKFSDFFHFFNYEMIRIHNTLLNFEKNEKALTKLNSSNFVLDYVQPMQIEAFRFIF